MSAVLNGEKLKLEIVSCALIITRLSIKIHFDLSKCQRCISSFSQLRGQLTARSKLSNVNLRKIIIHQRSHGKMHPPGKIHPCCCGPDCHFGNPLSNHLFSRGAQNNYDAKLSFNQLLLNVNCCRLWMKTSSMVLCTEVSQILP